MPSATPSATPFAFHRIAVIGAGAWGTALAQSALRAGRQVMLWAREPEVAEAINRDHANPLFLPEVPLSRALRATGDLAEAVDGADLVLLVTPAQHSAAMAAELPGTAAPLVLCAKGFEMATGALLTEAVGRARPEARLAVLSGPSFAREVALGLPTAVTLAATDEALGQAAAAALGHRAFRPYWSDDPLGVQIGGAVKNVLAIAAGIVMGREMGENARAALLTRGLAELMRLGAAMGARPETLMGLSGMGDLVLTASSLASRNTSLGHALGRGERLEAILGGRRSVSEGVHTAAAAIRLAERCGVEMPICAAVDAVINRAAGLDATIAALLDRPLKPEL